MSYRWDGDSLVIDCVIQPKSRSSEIAGMHGERLKIRVAAPPSDGKANKALIKFLAREFGVTQNAVSIVAGLSSRQKRVRIENPSRLVDGIERAI